MITDAENNTYKEIVKLLAGFFKNDKSKILVWMNTKIPLLAGQIPMEMISLGREKKLLKFIKSQLDDNNPGV